MLFAHMFHRLPDLIGTGESLRGNVPAVGIKGGNFWPEAVPEPGLALPFS
ncbi:MAG: hypothetical protein AAF497_29295 [Planctomycetota bacterium]